MSKKKKKPEDIAGGDDFRAWLVTEWGQMKEDRGEQTALLKTVVRQNAEQFERIGKIETTGCAIGTSNKETVERQDKEIQRQDKEIQKIKKVVGVIVLILSGLIGIDKLIDFIL